MSMLIDFVREALHQQHAWWDEAVSDLTPEQVSYRPGDRGNHIGFIVWHYVRTEDNLVQFIFQDRKPTVWLQGGYHEKFGLPRTAQGTGMSLEEAVNLRLPPLDQWLEYQRAVWQATAAWLDAVTEADFQRQVRVLPFGELPLGSALRISIVNHGFLHLGEVHHIRTMLGLKTTDL